jgi:hypothetical protein
MKVSWSINEYDSDGDCYEQCVKLHLNDTIILTFKSVDELMDLADTIRGFRREMMEQIKEPGDE